MTKKQLELEDISQQIVELGIMIASKIDGLESRIVSLENRMDSLENRMGNLENRMTAQEQQQRETNQRLERIEGKIDALEDDVRELYAMVAELRKDYDAGRIRHDELEARVVAAEALTKKLCKKTGIAYGA